MKSERPKGWRVHAHHTYVNDSINLIPTTQEEFDAEQTYEDAYPELVALETTEERQHFSMLRREHEWFTKSIR